MHLAGCTRRIRGHCKPSMAFAMWSSTSGELESEGTLLWQDFWGASVITCLFSIRMYSCPSSLSGQAIFLIFTPPSFPPLLCPTHIFPPLSLSSLDSWHFLQERKGWKCNSPLLSISLPEWGWRVIQIAFPPHPVTQRFQPQQGSDVYFIMKLWFN